MIADQMSWQEAFVTIVLIIVVGAVLIFWNR